MNISLNVISSAFENARRIPKKYTCEGQNINPPLSISGIPIETISLVIIMEDPDATIGVWDHWIVFDIPAENFLNGNFEVKEGESPKGSAGRGTSRNLDYYGPCPPTGEHRYSFKVFALDCMLGLPEGSVKEDLITAMDGHILAEGAVMGLYSREN